MLSSQWQASFNLLAESQLNLLPTNWEDITLSKSAEPQEVITVNFQRFLEENITGKFSIATLEWLSLAPRESAYQSWYLGIINGYHLFSIQVSGDFDFNLMVFDQDGNLRDRREVLWGNDGGSVDLIDQKIVQIKRFLTEDVYSGMEEMNFKIDLNGQFMELEGPYYIIPERNFPQASATLLSANSLKDISIDELKSIRNELLASSGFIFKDSQIQDFFESQNWYVPATNSIELSTLEEYNLVLIEQAITSK